MRGAYSEQACRERLPGFEVLPCKTFEDVFQAVEEGRTQLGMVPVENSMAGVISDSYDLLAIHKLKVVGEHFLRVRHSILAAHGTSLEAINTIYSHPQALAQCHAYLKKWGWRRLAVYDTAGAAKDLFQKNSPHDAAIASELCADLYDLQVLDRDVQDSHLNTTRFLVISKTPTQSEDELVQVPLKTSLLFEVRNIPASLYKCLGGFATNGVNLTRLESRPAPERPWVYHFYLDFEGRPGDRDCDLALEELNFFTEYLKILGTYPQEKKVTAPPDPPQDGEGA